VPSPVPESLLNTLFDRLGGSESLDLEFKLAKKQIPSSFWETVSAFANTRGGWIVLGVTQRDDGVVVEGVEDPDRLLQDFHNLTRNRQKLSCTVCGVDDASIESVQADDGTIRSLLIVRIPAAPRSARPVYINDNAYRGTFIRRHGGDYLCSKQEVDRMMREASEVAADSTVLSLYGLDDIDRDALARYRRLFLTLNRTSPFNSYDDLEFLKVIGAYERVRETNEEGLTLAGLLMFGTIPSIRERRGRHLIDYRHLSADQTASDRRWEDRIAWEGGIFGAFEAIYPRLTTSQPVPFRMERGTRIDEGPVHVALREALVNLLVHADYAEVEPSLVIRSSEGYYFQNPGSSRVPEADLLRGGRASPRNPRLVQMFRYVGWSEEAGSGIPKIVAAWRELGFRLPAINVGTERYEFSLDLRHSHILSTEDRDWLLSLGRSWTEVEQLALVIANHEGSVDNGRLSQLTGQHPTDVTKVLRDLRGRGLLRKVGAGRGARYVLGEQAKLRIEVGASFIPTGKGAVEIPTPAESDSAGVEPDSAALWDELWQISQPVREQRMVKIEDLEQTLVSLCRRTPLSLIQLGQLTGRDTGYLREPLRRLLRSGRLSFLHEQRNHPHQRYTVLHTSP
jgi:ATP-dependent DNA helicase RecG